MAQPLLQLSCCASSKNRNPDLQRSLENFSFDLSAPTQTTSTGEGVNTSRILSLFLLGLYAGSFDIKKYHEVMAQLLLQPSRCAAEGKIILTFKGRLRAFLSIFQNQSKQLRQERASTLLAYFPKIIKSFA